MFPLFALLPLLILHLHYFITVPIRSESSKHYALSEHSSESDLRRTKHSNSQGETMGSSLPVRSSSIKSTALQTQRSTFPLSACEVELHRHALLWLAFYGLQCCLWYLLWLPSCYLTVALWTPMSTFNANKYHFLFLNCHACGYLGAFQSLVS